jgi:hypothetical protein
MFEKSVLLKIFGPKRQGVNRGRREFLDEFGNFYPSSNIVRMKCI